MNAFQLGGTNIKLINVAKSSLCDSAQLKFTKILYWGKKVLSNSRLTKPKFEQQFPNCLNCKKFMFSIMTEILQKKTFATNQT